MLLECTTASTLPTGTMTMWGFEDRFWSRVLCDIETRCWIWTGASLKTGYGKLDDRLGNRSLAHRLSWNIHFGIIPNNLCVCHKCDVPACVRPDHLFLGTYQENATDMVAKGRSLRGKKHPLHIHPESIARGERHSSRTKPEKMFRKITYENALILCQQYELHNVSAVTLSKRFGISKSRVFQLLKLYRSDNLIKLQFKVKTVNRVRLVQGVPLI